MNKRAQELINILKLMPHPEGGYFKEIYRSRNKLISPINKQIRNSITTIYFLLIKGQISYLHRVLHDEIWHLYEGGPLELVEIDQDYLDVTKIVLSNVNNFYTHCIKGGNWQAAYSVGEYSLAGCTVAPGFDFSDFEFLKENVPACAAVLRKNSGLSKLL